MSVRWILAFAACAVLALALALGFGRLEQRTSTAGPTREEATVERARASELVGAREEAEAEQRTPESAERAGPIETGPSAEETSAAESAPTLVLYGFVRGPEGAALTESVGIGLVDRFGEAKRTDTGADGAYSFSGVAPGRYWLSAGSTRDGQAYEIVDLDAVRPERRVDLELERPPEVLVRVVDLGGEPLDAKGLLAVATREQPGDWFDDVRGSWNNSFGVGQFWQSGYAAPELPAGFIGRVVLAVEPPVLVSLLHSQRVIATKRVEPGQSQVVFEVDPRSPLMQKGSVRVRFLDGETRRPVVKIFPMLRSRGARMIATDDEGRCSYGNLEPGLARLSLYADGYESVDRWIRIEPGQELDLGEVLLGPGVAVKGEVVDESGAGIAVMIRFAAVEPGPSPSLGEESFVTVRSELDGTFRLAGLSAKPYQLSVTSEDKELTTAARVVDLRTGSVEGLRIELVRGVPFVVRASDERWREVEFALIDAAGERVLESELYSPAPHRILLAPGRYEVEVRVGGAVLPERIPVTIDAEPVELALP